MLSEKRPKAIDLSHHLSDVAKARSTSPLKALQRYWGKPGLISMAGGLPSPAYFPFEAISGTALLPDSFPAPKASPLSWFWKFFAKRDLEHNTTLVSIPKYPVNSGDVNLADSLQYHMSKGIPALQEIIKEFVGKVYKPAYEDFVTLAHTGNTDGWYRTVVTLCNPGEGILVAEWTYPSAMAVTRPHGIKTVPVAIDTEGIRPDDLRNVLLEWDNVARGMSRPHVLYTVPVGQNPTGATMGAARKKEIYNICVEFDIIIVEDDPYFFLQEGPYFPRSQRQTHEVTSEGGEEEYIASLAPSFVKFDYQGRVIRMDTLSKTIAPGSRMGWFTCNPLFAERLERHGEVSAQAPCGFGQSLVTKLLLTWKYEGYIRWLKGVSAQYTLRRDQFLDHLGDEFHLKVDPAIGSRSDVYFAFLKAKDFVADTQNEKFPDYSKPIFSFTPPTSGMFVWIKLHFENCPSKPPSDQSLEMQLWTLLAEAGLLLAPGYMFQAMQSPNDMDGHFRISFSEIKLGDMKRAIVLFERILREFFAES